MDSVLFLCVSIFPIALIFVALLIGNRLEASRPIAERLSNFSFATGVIALLAGTTQHKFVPHSNGGFFPPVESHYTYGYPFTWLGRRKFLGFPTTTFAILGDVALFSIFCLILLAVASWIITKFNFSINKRYCYAAIVLVVGLMPAYLPYIFLYGIWPIYPQIFDWAWPIF